MQYWIIPDSLSMGLWIIHNVNLIFPQSWNLKLCCFCFLLFSEYIVSFDGYYSSEARDGFITAALRRFSGWSIIARNNPSQDFPSDFSLVQLKEGVAGALEALSHHPSIKRVTPQKKLTRMLTFTGSGESACFFGYSWLVHKVRNIHKWFINVYCIFGNRFWWVWSVMWLGVSLDVQVSTLGRTVIIHCSCVLYNSISLSLHTHAHHIRRQMTKHSLHDTPVS